MFLVAAICLPGCAEPGEPADLVIRNAVIYTAEPGDTNTPVTGSVAVRDGRIVYVGSDREIRGLIGDQTETVDGTGGMLLPGFNDSHVHPASGLDLMECDLSGASTPEEAMSVIRRCAGERPTAAWIRGTGWELPVFRDANPTASLLDQAVPDRPAYITAADGHSAWVNSRAIEAAGLTRASADPPKGRIERDRTGAPSGTLRESAMELVERLLPAYSIEDYTEGFRRAFEMAGQYGITSMIEADADSMMLEAYHRMDSAGQLTVRLTAAQQLDHSPGPLQVERVIRLRDRYRSELLDPNMAKIFMDGVIEAQTAALLTPYLSRPRYTGETNLEAGAMDSLVTALDKAGVQVHVHAIGDRAIRMTLDAFEHARAVNGRRDSRHMMAHIELIDSLDIPRFKALEVIANFQPLWAYDDPYIVDLTMPILGPARSRWLYPIASVLATGATVVGGSDWSVSSMNPLEAIQVAVTRRAPDSGSGEGWIPEERADLRSLLAAYTINGAYARFADSTTGSITIGKLADLTLLERNLFTIPPHEIGKTRVLLTVMGGRVVYRASAAPR